MTPDEFIERFVDTAYRSAVRQVRGSLIDPLGRRPDAGLVAASRWYRGLSDADRAMAEIVIAQAAHAAAFGALAVIDGVRSSGPARFELTAVEANGDRTAISPSDEYLHDRFQGLVMRPDGTLIE